MNILLVLSGTPPEKKLLESQMSAADLVIAVDGGYNVFQKYKLSPHLIIGDLDSVDTTINESTRVIKTPDQNYTDLEKALQYLFEKYTPSSLVLLGATGGRTDHLLNNLHICASLRNSLKIKILSEKCIAGKMQLETISRITSECNIDFKVNRNAIISVLPVTQYSGLYSRGLKWEIVESSHEHGNLVQSNIAIKDDPQVTVASGVVYIVVYQ